MEFIIQNKGGLLEFDFISIFLTNLTTIRVSLIPQLLNYLTLFRSLSIFRHPFEESAFNAGDPGLISGSGKSPGERMGRGAWWAMVHGVTESDMTK